MNCSSRRRIASNLLLSGGELVENPLVEVDVETGEILAVERLNVTSEADCRSHTEFYSGILMAGFVNAHCHLELSHLRGAITEGCGLQNFVRSVGELRHRCDEDFALSEMERADVEMQRGGVAAVGDIVNHDMAGQMKARSKVEYLDFVETFGLRRENLDDVKNLLKEERSVLTPHSTYSLNDTFFREIAEQDSALPLSIHFMESESEALLFERRGTLYDWFLAQRFDCDFLHYSSPAERIVSCVPPTRSVILVHNCAITQDDIDLIMGHFTAPVYWAICPQSNYYISRKRPPVELLRHNGLNICLGTDSLASSPSLLPLDDLCMLPGIPLAERLDWATRQGAAALGFEHLGDVKVGKRPRLNVLSGIDYSTRELLPTSRIRCVL